MEILEIHTKIMKIIEIRLRIMKIMKIQEIHWRINQIMKSQKPMRE